jgi:hypothetical protein
MTTYFTAHSAHSFGRWLAAMAVSLVLLALAYAHAPDPAWYLGFNSPSSRTLAHSRPAPSQTHGHRLAADRVPTLAAAQVGQTTNKSPRAQFAR